MTNPSQVPPQIRQIDFVDHVPRPVIAFGMEYPDGHFIEPHQHRRGQLMSCTQGLIVLTTPEGTWVMPPLRGMWIPPATEHHVRIVGAVKMLSLYVATEAVPDMPNHCQVVGIPPFMHGLMTEALSLPHEYDYGSRAGAIMALIQHEMQQLPALPLSLHYPADGPLAARCQSFLKQPSIHATIDDWSRKLGMSRRAFTRLFRRETGQSFMAWRQQACLLCAMPRLAAGEPVTSVAIDLGYENPAAFTMMFKRAFGSPPLTYLGFRSSRESA